MLCGTTGTAQSPSFDEADATPNRVEGMDVASLSADLAGDLAFIFERNPLYGGTEKGRSSASKECNEQIGRRLLSNLPQHFSRSVNGSHRRLIEPRWSGRMQVNRLCRLQAIIWHMYPALQLDPMHAWEKCLFEASHHAGGCFSGTHNQNALQRRHGDLPRLNSQRCLVNLYAILHEHIPPNRTHSCLPNRHRLVTECCHCRRDLAAGRMRGGRPSTCR